MSKDSKQDAPTVSRKPYDLDQWRLLSPAELQRRVDALFEANGKLSNKYPRPIAGPSF